MSPDDLFVTGFEGTPVTDYMTISNGRFRKARYLYIVTGIVVTPVTDVYLVTGVVVTPVTDVRYRIQKTAAHLLN
jgi:hypothetical protein